MLFNLEEAYCVQAIGRRLTMVTYAYLRVSTDRQDVDNQRHGILEYANTHGLVPVQFVQDALSGRLAWRERAIGQLLTATTRAGDVVIFAEISRMARSTLQVLEMLETGMTRELHIHLAKQRMIFDGSLHSRIAATVLGLAAEIERELIAARTREALAKRKADGKVLGRPKGAASAHLKLDGHAEVIRGWTCSHESGHIWEAQSPHPAGHKIELQTTQYAA
jgi:DNA invertase Pin-like site-specific DNA recombinase